MTMLWRKQKGEHMENKDTNVLVDEVIKATCEWIKEQLKTTQALARVAYLQR